MYSKAAESDEASRKQQDSEGWSRKGYHKFKASLGYEMKPYDRERNRDRELIRINLNITLIQIINLPSRTKWEQSLTPEVNFLIFL